jgi:hypothetical protein
MSDSGTKPVCLGEETVQDKIVQTWAEAKKKVMALLEPCSVSATPEQGRAMKEGRALIVEDEVTEAEKRYEYWSANNECVSRCPPLAIIIIFSFFMTVIIIWALEGNFAAIIMWGIPFVLLLSLCVIPPIGLCIAKCKLKKAKERAKVSTEVTAVARKAEETFCQATSHATISTHNDSTENKSELVIARQ